MAAFFCALILFCLSIEPSNMAESSACVVSVCARSSRTTTQRYLVTCDKRGVDIFCLQSLCPCYGKCQSLCVSVLNSSTVDSLDMYITDTDPCTVLCCKWMHIKWSLWNIAPVLLQFISCYIKLSFVVVSGNPLSRTICAYILADFFGIRGRLGSLKLT